MPALRWFSHLVAPGWNVQGGSEPPFAGIDAGHNDQRAWGFTFAGTDMVDVYVERLSLRPDSLDSFYCCALAFMPALSTRGPNGAWVIERGPNHPLVKAFSPVAVWTLAGVDGIVRGTQFGVAEDARWDRYADGLELFPSEEAAQAAEDSFVYLGDDATEEEDRFVPLPLNGEQLLRLMGGQDLLMLSNGQEVPLTWAGVQYCRASGESVDQVPSADDVVNHLTRLRDAPLRAE